jgi:hypothetical protein
MKNRACMVLASAQLVFPIKLMSRPSTALMQIKEGFSPPAGAPEVGAAQTEE